jgi:hypothetical protein
MLALALLALIQMGDLDSKDPAIARRAFEEVIRAGDEKVLEAAAKSSDRARLALAEVRAHKRFGENYPPVKLISFKATDQRLIQIVQDFSKAIDMTVEDYHRNRGLKGDEMATLELVEAYPLEAIDRMLNAINAQGWIHGNKLQFTRGWTRKSAHTFYWRHVALFPYQLIEEKTLDPLGKTVESCTLMVSLRHDGASRMLSTRPVRSVEAIDNRGVAVKAGADEAEHYHQFASFRIRLESVPAESASFQRIRGVVPIVIPENRIWKSVPVGSRGAQVDFLDVKLTVENFALPATEVRVRVRYTEARKPSLGVDVQDFFLVGKDGAEVRANGTWAQQGILDLTFNPPAGFIPANLKIGSFESLGEHEIPFEFREVKIR